MKHSLPGFVKSLVSCLMVFTLVLPFNATLGLATETALPPALTKVKHNQLKYVVPGKRIAIEAEITDPEGISLARCYFKSPEEANFVFVPMTASGDTYRAILPAMARDAASLKYVFLSVNGKKQIARTQQFDVPVDALKEIPKWQQESDGKPVKVGVEQDKAPETVAGFSDSIQYDVVESAARFGVAGGLAGWAISTSSGGAAAGGAAATSATAVTATGTGLSTTAIVTIAGGIAVAGGVTAAAAGGGGGDGPQPATTYKANGSVSSSGTGLANVTLNLSGNGQSATATTDASGNFTITGLPNGSYTITPAKTGYTFSPPSMNVTINSSDTGALSFTASSNGAITVTW